jgi:tRNA(Ile)-lysidine synthase
MSTNSQLVKTIESCVFPHFSSVTVALSGGVDSAAMLHACATIREQSDLPFSVNAIHIHHGLSPNADEWLTFCHQLCEQLHIPFQYQKVLVQVAPRQSLEAVARNARYAALDKLAPAGSLVLLAQHEDDQAETVLLQLKRGAGPKGLSGMAERFTKSSSVQYARPWVNSGIGKQEILRYAEQHKLSWVEDESNQNTSFDRNFLRNDIMPVLKDKWPQISKTINRSAWLCASQNRLVETMAGEALQKIQNEECALSLSGLSILPNALAAEVIRLWSSIQIGLTVSAAQLYEIQKLCVAKADQKGRVQVENWQCRSFNQYLFWVGVDDVVEMPLPNQYVEIEINSKIERMNVTYGDLHRRVSLFANRPTKTLKVWMKEAVVKPWKRMAMPIICLNEQIVAVQLGDKLVVNEQFKDKALIQSAIKRLIEQG